MDSDKCLCCLSLNLALKFVVMSSSSSSSLTMGGTTRSILVFSFVLAAEEMKKERRMKLMKKMEMRVAESLPFEWAEQQVLSSF